MMNPHSPWLLKCNMSHLREATNHLILYQEQNK